MSNKNVPNNIENNENIQTNADKTANETPRNVQPEGNASTSDKPQEKLKNTADSVKETPECTQPEENASTSDKKENTSQKQNQPDTVNDKEQGFWKSVGKSVVKFFRFRYHTSALLFATPIGYLGLGFYLLKNPLWDKKAPFADFAITPKIISWVVSWPLAAPICLLGNIIPAVKWSKEKIQKTIDRHPGLKDKIEKYKRKVNEALKKIFTSGELVVQMDPIDDSPHDISNATEDPTIADSANKGKTVDVDTKESTAQINPVDVDTAPKKKISSNDLEKINMPKGRSDKGSHSKGGPSQ